MKSGKRKGLTFGTMAVSLAVCVWLTNSTNASRGAVIMNCTVLGIMLLLIVTAYFCGIGKVNKIIKGVTGAIRAIDGILKQTDQREKLCQLQFSNPYLKRKFADFLQYQNKYPDADIEDFINEDDISISTHRNVWEVVSDFLTSIGILGTFVGLIIGLQGFNINELSEFSDSVAPLLDGIKVAFLTSVYGISLSLSYSYGLLSAYGEMEETVGTFLEKFHIAWGKEQLAEEKMLSEQKQQTEILRELTETFSTQLAESFSEVITPTIMKLNDQFEIYSAGQQQMLKEAAIQFAEEFRNSFVGGFTQFEKNLEKTNEMQTQYMVFLNDSMSALNLAIEENQNTAKNCMMENAIQQDKNMQSMSENIGKISLLVNTLAKASNEYYDAAVKAADRMDNTGHVLERELQALMEQIALLSGELSKQAEKDYTASFAVLNEAIVNSALKISGKLQVTNQTLKDEKELIEENRTALKEIQTLIMCSSEETKKWENERMEHGEKQPNTDDNTKVCNELCKSMNKILQKMNELVELEKNRQNKGLLDLFSKKNK